MPGLHSALLPEGFWNFILIPTFCLFADPVNHPCRASGNGGNPAFYALLTITFSTKLSLPADAILSTTSDRSAGPAPPPGLTMKARPNPPHNKKNTIHPPPAGHPAPGSPCLPPQPPPPAPASPPP